MSKESGLWLLTILVFFSLLVSGCNAPVPSPTTVPPSPTAVPTSTPVPPDNPPVNPVPAVKNFSLVTGLVVNVSPDSSDPALLLLTMNVAATSHVEPYPSFTDDKVGQEIVISIDSSLAGTVASGKNVQVKVSYRGDEQGGRFYGSDLTTLP